ncbi:MAG: serine/threonine-protein kinase, partial [Verrucomicrobiota bacterium]
MCLNRVMAEESGQRTLLNNAVAMDAICDRFEADLKRGESPEIRTALDEVEAESRPELFQQLLGVQQSMMAKPPAITELLAEFPEYREEVLGVCAPGAEAMLREIQPDERYEAGDEVARGGMGAIRLADDVALRRQVAIKSMLADDASPDELARFIEEAQITGQLDHPGIVPIHEIGVDGDGQPFYSMQFVRGRDLQAVLKEDDLSLRQLLNILNRVCDAVAFAHSKGVLHRDLKPANIRIGEFGEVFVMDWGLAKILGKSDRPAAAGKVESIRGESVTGEF